MSLNPVEMFKIARNLEKKGVDFYLKARDFTTDKINKELFDSLAEMEKTHLKIFGGMERKVKTCSYSDSDEINSYLNQFLDPKIFNQNDSQKISKELKTVLEIFNYALKMEKDSVEFYTFVKSGITDKEVLSAIEEIIQEENQHIQLINEYINKVK